MPLASTTILATSNCDLVDMSGISYACAIDGKVTLEFVDPQKHGAIDLRLEEV